MVEVINSSFIPKNEFKKAPTRKSGSRVNVFFLISLIIFLASIVGSVGVYLWKKDLEKSNEISLKKLKAIDSAAMTESIKKYVNVSRKIKASRELLKKHYNILPIFAYLEKETLKDVTLKGLTLSEKDQYIEVSSSGEAPALSDLQLQSRAYAENKNVSGLILSNITKSREGMSVFDLNFKVNKDFLTTRRF